MAYTKNKAYTDHPLMDEICYHCKRILKGIVVKNDVLVIRSETEKSIENSEMYMLYKQYGSISFDLFPFSEDLLYAFGYNKFQVKAILKDKKAVPESDKEALTEFANKYFLDNYFDENGKFIEENNYYRTLTGLPPYDTGDEYYIYLSESDIPSRYDRDIDLSIPLHLQDTYLINILYSDGTIDSFRKKYPGSNYSYMMYLGDRSIDWFTARQAAKWDILYIPNVNELVRDKFIEFYKVNRDMYAYRSYQEFYADSGDYYDQMMILIVLAQTFNDMIVDTPQWYIRRDIFDLRSCNYFMESSGVEFFKVIPLKYQIRIVKNLNRLISYKSSNVNAKDILEIFNVENTKIFKYWLYKRKVTDENPPEEETPVEPDPEPPIEPSDYDLDFGCYEHGKVPESIIGENEDWDFNLKATDDEPEVIDDKNTSEEDRDNIVDTTDKYAGKYELEFISSEIGESYDDYIKESRYRTPYDDITLQDKFWDGDLDHEYVKKQILEKDFTIVGTKYMSIEYEVDLQKFQYQMSYLMGLIINSDLNMNDITVGVPSLDEFSQFTISDLFLFMIALTNNYSILDGRKGTETRLFDLWQGAAPEVDEKLYDWKKKYFPESFIKKDGRILGFNPNVDMDSFIEILERRHSHHRFGLGDNENDLPLVGEAYKNRADEWIQELGVFDYIVPNYTISSIKDFVDLYHNNTKCYETLQTALAEARDQDDKKYMEYIFEELYTRDFDINYYTNPRTNKTYDNLVDIIKDHNYILYSAYYKIMQETNIESRQDNIRAIMNDIITTLDYYLSSDGMDFLFSFTSNESFTSILYYIYLLINFFKSYKVYFLDPYVTFSSSDKVENSAKAIDRIAEWKYEYSKWDKAFVSDYIESLTRKMNIHEEGVEENAVEQVDIFAHYSPDLFMDYDFDGSFDPDETDELDGGSISDELNTPYSMINGGFPAQKDINIKDINGGEPDEYTRYYYELDGGSVFNPDDNKTDMFGGQMFNYMIDGGAVYGRKFINHSLELWLIGTELLGNVRISKRSNYIEILDDGLYVSEDTFVDMTQFINAVTGASDTMIEVLNTGAEVAENIEVLEDEDALLKRIDSQVDGVLYNMKYANENLIDSNMYESSLKEFVDTLNQNLIEELEGILSPYYWEEL